MKHFKESFQEALKAGYAIGNKICEQNIGISSLNASVAPKVGSDNFSTGSSSSSKAIHLTDKDIVVTPDFLQQLINWLTSDPKAKEYAPTIIQNIIQVSKHKKNVGSSLVPTALTQSDIPDVFSDIKPLETISCGTNPLNSVVVAPVNPTFTTQSKVMESYLKKVHQFLLEKKNKKPCVSLTQIARFISSTPEIDKKIVKGKDKKDAKEVSYKVNKDTVDVIVTYEDGNNKLIKSIATSTFCKKYMKDWLKVWGETRKKIKTEHDIIPNASHEVIINPDEMGKKNPSIKSPVLKQNIKESVLQTHWIIEKVIKSIKNDKDLNDVAKFSIIEKVKKIKEKVKTVENLLDVDPYAEYDYDPYQDLENLEIEIVPSPSLITTLEPTLSFDDTLTGVSVTSSDSEHIISRSLVDNDETENEDEEEDDLEDDWFDDEEDDDEEEDDEENDEEEEDEDDDEEEDDDKDDEEDDDDEEEDDDEDSDEEEEDDDDEENEENDEDGDEEDEEEDNDENDDDDDKKESKKRINESNKKMFTFEEDPLDDDTIAEEEEEDKLEEINEFDEDEDDFLKEKDDLDLDDLDINENEKNRDIKEKENCKECDQK